MDEKQYKLLSRIAIIMVVAWVGWSLFDAGLIDLDPEAYELDAARKHLEDGQFDEALSLYEKVSSANPENLGALRGMAQALILLGAQIEAEPNATQPTPQAEATALTNYHRALVYYDEAIAREEAEETTPLRQRILGVSYANRGILRDRLGDYHGALADYSKSLQLAPEVAEGPRFLVRFMRNQADKPPTIADRARYLSTELSKPENERLLRMPELDARQRAYSMD